MTDHRCAIFTRCAHYFAQHPGSPDQVILAVNKDGTVFNLVLSTLEHLERIIGVPAGGQTEKGIHVLLECQWEIDADLATWSTSFFVWTEKGIEIAFSDLCPELEE